MISESDRQRVQKWPLLGDLPLIGQLFRQSSSSRLKSELVVIVTPRCCSMERRQTSVTAINPQRRPRAAWFRAAADATQGTIGISAFRAIGASAWAVDSAPPSRAEPMPLPEAVWGCRADHARAGWRPRADRPSGCRPGWRTALPGPGRLRRGRFPCSPRLRPRATQLSGSCGLTWIAAPNSCSAAGQRPDCAASTPALCRLAWLRAPG